MGTIMLCGREYDMDLVGSIDEVDRLAFDLGEASLEYIVTLPALKDGEREKLQEARDIVLNLRQLEREEEG